METGSAKRPVPLLRISTHIKLWNELFCKIKFDSLTYFYFLFNSDFDCFRPKQFDCCLMRWVHRDTVRYRHVEFITIHYSWLILFTRRVRILPIPVWETFHESWIMILFTAVWPRLFKVLQQFNSFCFRTDSRIHYVKNCLFSKRLVTSLIGGKTKSLRFLHFRPWFSQSKVACRLSDLSRTKSDKQILRV